MKLVLRPGLDGTGVLFRPFLDVLPTHIEAMVVSYPTRQPLGYADLLPRVLAALPRNEPFVLLGESFGGPLSLRVAAARPPGLKALVLCGSFVSCPFAWVPTWAEHGVPSFPFRAFPLVAKLKSRLGLYRTREHFALSMEALSQVAPHVFARRIREIVRIDVTAELRACSVPLLYLQGARDRIVPASNLRRIVDIRPDMQTVRIDSSHMILKTEPVAALNAILNFIAALERAPSYRNS